MEKVAVVLAAMQAISGRNGRRVQASRIPRQPRRSAADRLPRRLTIRDRLEGIATGSGLVEAAAKPLAGPIESQGERRSSQLTPVNGGTVVREQ